MDRRRWLVLVVAAVAAFAIAFYLGSDEGDDDGDGGSALQVDDLEALSLEGRELVAQVEQGARVPHHAVYEQSGGHRFEVWTDGEQVREETTPAEGDRRLLLRTDGDTVACVEEDGAWSCDEPIETAVGLQGRLDQLIADLMGAEVAVTQAEIADVDVRCFAIEGAEEPVEICLTAEGVLARLAAGGDQLELVALDDDVDESDFEVPE